MMNHAALPKKTNGVLTNYNYLMSFIMDFLFHIKYVNILLLMCMNRDITFWTDFARGRENISWSSIT